MDTCLPWVLWQYLSRVQSLPWVQWQCQWVQSVRRSPFVPFHYTKICQLARKDPKAYKDPKDLKVFKVQLDCKGHKAFKASKETKAFKVQPDFKDLADLKEDPQGQLECKDLGVQKEDPQDRQDPQDPLGLDPRDPQDPWE